MARSQRSSTRGSSGGSGGGGRGRKGRKSAPIQFGHEDSYAKASTQPLHVLAFLLPLLVVYEILSAVYLSGGGSEGAARMIRAEGLLTQFFRWFGVGGLYLPGIAMVVTLLLWHTMTRAKWTIRLPVLGWMFIESIVWTPPLVVLLQLAGRFATGTPAGMTGAPPTFMLDLIPLASAMNPGSGAGASALEALSVGERATIAIGAGLYEELLFRMLGIAGVHLVAADLMGMRDKWARAVAVVASAAAFAYYHDVTLATGGLDWAKMIIFFLAGLYFGVIYVVRGFGIVVATHAIYDLAVLVLLPSGR